MKIWRETDVKCINQEISAFVVVKEEEKKRRQITTCTCNKNLNAMIIIATGINMEYKLVNTLLEAD